MFKNEVSAVKFNVTPDVRVRVINKEDSKEVKKNKKKFPFKLYNDVIVTVFSDDFKFSFKIQKGYVWNGADIPKPLWWVGSSKDNDFLIASMVHDFLLEYKEFIYKEVLKEKIGIEEYRRLTSLTFRQILKDSDICTIKANVMSWFVDMWQATVNKKAWVF